MRSELGRIWPPPPLAGRGPNPPASLTGWRPSRGQFRAHKLRPSRGNFCDLRRIFADAKILVSDFCVRKNPSAYYAKASLTGKRPYYALVRRSHIPLKRTREGCARICPRTNPTSGRLLRFSVISARIFVGRIICVPHGANYALGIRDRDREFRLSASQSASAP